MSDAGDAGDRDNSGRSNGKDNDEPKKDKAEPGDSKKDESAKDNDKNEDQEKDKSKEAKDVQDGIDISDPASVKDAMVGRALATLAIGFAFYYKAILESWKSCRDDNLCKAEKLVKYLTVILGVSRPAYLISDLLQNGIGRAWSMLRGDTGTSTYAWVSGAFWLLIYSLIEYYLTFALDWVRYSTECLKKLDDCEADDILIWISNMKQKYCTEDDGDYSATLNCGSYGTDCIEDDDTDMDEVSHNDMCLMFFNELPIIMLALVIWVIYIISLGIQDKKLGPSPGQAPPPPPTSGMIVPEDQNHNDGMKLHSISPDTKTSEENDKEGNGTETGEKEESNNESASDKAKSYPFQEIELRCPCCQKNYVVTYPDPLRIHCEDCKPDQGKGKNNGNCSCANVGKSEKREETTTTAPRNKQRHRKSDKANEEVVSPDKEPDNSEGPSKSSASGSAVSLCLNSMEDLESSDSDSEESSESSRISSREEGDDEEDEEEEGMEYAELYELYESVATEMKEELLAYAMEPTFCEDCGYHHIDHDHELDEEENNEAEWIDESECI